MNMKDSNIKDSGERTSFDTGAVRDMHQGKGRMDLLPWNAIIEVSKHCEKGALKYGENNIDKGIPLHSLLDSAMRHGAKFIAGEDDEDHLVAAAWNILWAVEFRKTMPELNDLYNWKINEQYKIWIEGYKETLLGRETGREESEENEVAEHSDRRVGASLQQDK